MRHRRLVKEIAVCVLFSTLSFYLGSVYGTLRAKGIAADLTQRSCSWQNHDLVFQAPLVATKTRRRVTIRSSVDNREIGFIEVEGKAVTTDREWLIALGKRQGKNLERRIATEQLFSEAVPVAITKTFAEDQTFHMVGTYVVAGIRYSFYFYAQMDHEWGALCMQKVYKMLATSRVRFPS